MWVGPPGPSSRHIVCVLSANEELPDMTTLFEWIYFLIFSFLFGLVHFHLISFLITLLCIAYF